jgi:hypothetical protein
MAIWKERLLGAKGLFLLKQKRSKDALVKYVSLRNYLKMMKDLEAGKMGEPEYQNLIYASMFAITTLGEIGDDSVVQLLDL